PGGWMVEVTDNDLIVGSVGCRSQLTTGNTNTLPVNIDYDDYTVTFLPDPALVERTVDNQTWTTVRRAAELVPAVGAVSAVDYEFGPDVPNTYRVNTAPVTTLPLAGRLTTDGAGTLANLDASGLTFDLVGRMLRLTLTVDDPVHIGGLNFFTGIGGLTNHIKWRFAAGFTLVPMAKPNERFTVLLQFAEINTVGGTITLSAQGVPSTKSGFTDARLQVFDDGTRPITVILHKAEIVPVAVPGAYASVVFDDSDASITSLAFPKMAALGFRGTDYVIPLSLGLGGKSTLADVQARAAAGWEIAGHSYDGNVHDARYTGSTSAVVKADLASLFGWLEANVSHPGKRYSFAYPGGEWSQTTDGHPIERLVRQAGFVSGRTTMGNVGVSTHVQVANPRPPLPFRLHAMSAISSLSSGNSNPATLTAAGGMLDKVAANGGWIILVFHKVVVGAPATGTEISQTDFDAIMDALAAKGLTVLPVREVVDELAATTTPTLDGVWLKSTSDPSLNRKVTVTGFSPFRRRGRAGIFDVKGRADPVAVTDVRSSKAFRLDLRTDPPAEVDGIDELLDGGEALFIQAPTTGRLSRVPTGYVTVADSAQEVLPTVDLQTDVISLDCTRVAAPEA
ncbi:MAG TPA: hypothetical protein VFY84_14220, partial [Jiangellales bacterium]|nr:hypothetical protein [Jiangellales bacterium]